MCVQLLLEELYPAQPMRVQLLLEELYPAQPMRRLKVSPLPQAIETVSCD